MRIARHLVAADRIQEPWETGPALEAAEHLQLDGNLQMAIQCLRLAATAPRATDRRQAAIRAELARTGMAVKPASSAARHLGRLTASQPGGLDRRGLPTLLRQLLLSSVAESGRRCGARPDARFRGRGQRRRRLVSCATPRCGCPPPIRPTSAGGADLAPSPPAARASSPRAPTPGCARRRRVCDHLARRRGPARLATRAEEVHCAICGSAGEAPGPRRPR
ncbi:hypothetical protein LV779_19285 [Streptomyces thinghirensis]|nr:hypothetical protein [Streptomyces thinghirensis]